jgi:maleate isomerase
MAFSSWRGTVGIIRPTLRTGGFEDLVRMLPDGIGVIPLCLNVQRGALDEFQKGIHAYEPKIAELVEAGVDLVNPSGAPPFMVLGYQGEKELIKTWETKYQTTVFKYFADAGFDVLDMAGMDVDFDKVQELSSREVYRFVKSVFLKNEEAQAIYMLGPAWRTLDIIEMLEQDLGVPVIHAIPAQCWDIQRHLNVRQPVKGFGRLIAEMPSPGNG